MNKNGPAKKFKIIAVLISFMFAVYFINYDNVTTFSKDYKNSLIYCNFEGKRNSTELKPSIKCDNIDFNNEIKQHGKFWILQNFVKSKKYFECHESITYATHSDLSFLDNIIPLVKRWEGPISIVIYAPGSDFNLTLNAIFYLRNCVEEKESVKDFVTFHVFFEEEFYYEEISESYSKAEIFLNCSTNFLDNSTKTFKSIHHLNYPVNVARNLARNSSMTHLVLVSDIELYPSVNLIKDFFKMLSICSYDEQIFHDNVFVFPIFEIDSNQLPPENKIELIALYNDKKAFWFHFKICKTCHEIPYSKQWLQDNSTEMKITSRNKRIGAFYHWEPLYVGTKDLPLYDERLNWEGKSDKMPQAHIMCLLDFNFNILSNAFLVHRPGIKTIKEAKRPALENKNRRIILDQILPEIERKYGKNKNCKMFS